MTIARSQQGRSAPLTREAAEALAASLVEEMIRLWRQGRRLITEDFLTGHPQLWEHPEAVADLIYEEVCLRQECGSDVAVEEVLRRFPQWRPQLEVLFDCQRLLGPGRDATPFPAVGESLGDFLLLEELGRGARGRAYLASQLSLGDRPVTVKVIPCEGREHLALARLQHTHIVPLYCIQDHPARGLRALCMPYFGGATLARVLEALRPHPLTSTKDRQAGRHTGQDLLEALDRVSGPAPAEQRAEAKTGPSPARRFLSRASYEQAVCWIGACLADALHYAHERGLVHLDIKPANVLLAADGQPMVLDFDLAREPIPADGEVPRWLGGTAGYLSPEQEAAMLAVQQGQPVPRLVDGRSDIYSLGVVLYEALTGMPVPGRTARSSITARGGVRVGPASRAGPEAPGSIPEAELAKSSGRHPSRSLGDFGYRKSVALADVVRKCLADDPARRYPHMAALAADLRRHLADLPLAGVRNRSLRERWRKWRRRRPQGLALAVLLVAALVTVGAILVGVTSFFTRQLEQARTALVRGQTQIAAGEYAGAITTLQHGRSAARGLPFQHELADELDRQLRRAEEARAAADRAAAARELHLLSDRARFLYGADHLPAEALRGLTASCQTFWDQRESVVKRLSPGGASTLKPSVREDLLDLAIFLADVEAHVTAGSSQALAVLDQAEKLLGPSPVLDAERKLHGAAGSRREARAETAWEHYALGRALLRSGDLERAAAETGQAVRLQPQGLWPNFYQGLCAYRLGRYERAVTAYSVCIGAAPEAAGCFYNRALAFAALGRTEQAAEDYEQAVRLDPTLAVASRKQRLLPYQKGVTPRTPPRPGME
jgi:serine/threonine protein kinase